MRPSRGGGVMGWAQRNLSQEQRGAIARTLFKVEIVDGDWLNGLCPFHEDQTPSFGYNVKDDVFKCLALCTDSGDLVDLFCRVKGYPTQSKEGFRAFKSAYAPDSRPTRNPTEDAGQTRRRLCGWCGYQNRKKARGAPSPEHVNNEIPEHVLSTLAPIPDSMLKQLEEKRGWSREVIEKMGVRLLSHYRRKSNLYELFPIKERDRVAIPVRDEAGVLRNIRTYYPFGKPETAPAKIMSWGKGHGSAMLFPAANLLRPGKVILLEGEPDELCGLSHDLNVITQTGKPDTWPRTHTDALKGRDVVIAYDADAAGQKYARKAAKNLVALIAGFGCWNGPTIWGVSLTEHGRKITDRI